RQLGFSSIFIAHNAAEAVQIMREIKISFIMADARLRAVSPEMMAILSQTADGDEKLDIPQLDGFHFVERLRYSSASPNQVLPIMMTINKAKKDEVLRARDSGVNEILLKPFNADDLCRRIMALIDHPRI